MKTMRYQEVIIETVIVGTCRKKLVFLHNVETGEKGL
jgi:hypothetical protein